MTGRLYRCYAKINLTLEILGRRDDGYHDLVSLMHTIGLADDLRIADAETLTTRVEGLDIEPAANLVSRAATLLDGALSGRHGATLTLVKRIPAAAGLGGGSSDAATTLVGLNHVWRAGVSLSGLTDLAAAIGSDVPFFVRGGAAIARGRGEILEPLPPLHGQWLVLVVPSHAVTDKTRRLYGALSPADYASGEATDRAAAHLVTGQVRNEDLVNGFSRVARSSFPSLNAAWSEVEERCGRPFHLSGAGPALFALAENRPDALRQVARLADGPYVVQAVRTVKHARASIRVTAAPSIEYP